VLHQRLYIYQPNYTTSYPTRP